MKADITFPTREMAERFATDWSRKTKKGHIVWAGTENVKVTVHDVTDEDVYFIDEYIEKLKKQL